MLSLRVSTRKAGRVQQSPKWADLALIREIANELGLDSPYFEQVLRQWALHLQTYYALDNLLKVVL